MPGGWRRSGRSTSCCSGTRWSLPAAQAPGAAGTAAGVVAVDQLVMRLPQLGRHAVHRLVEGLAELLAPHVGDQGAAPGHVGHQLDVVVGALAAEGDADPAHLLTSRGAIDNENEHPIALRVCMVLPTAILSDRRIFA